LGRPDRYGTFAELTRHHRENHDWRHFVRPRSAAAAVLAPHGGNIEPGTSEIATAVAGAELSLYCFEGLRRWRNGILHISSTRFDDPICLDLLEFVRIAVTIHGCADSRDVVYVGGLHQELRAAVATSLSAAGFRATQDDTIHSGTDPANICNRALDGRGLQLEISRGLRADMFAGPRAAGRQAPLAKFGAFVAAVRAVLLPGAALTARS
jgi:phage replication-related protein YjqB (UPF0714/DUF867 family)